MRIRQCTQRFCRRWWLLLVIVPLLAGGCGTTTPWEEAVAPLHVPREPSESIQVAEAAEPELWFNVGERIRYKGYWGVIPVAESRVTTEWIQEDGRRLLAIRFRSKSNKYLSKIYPIDDLIESIIDPVTFLPVRFTKRINEGTYHADETTTFDYEALKATWVRKRDGRVKQYDIDPDTRDIVSFMYFMRQEPIAVGDDMRYRVMSDEKLYDLYVKATKVEKVKTVSGDKRQSVRMDPKASFQGLFVRKGKMSLWVSDDDTRVVTRMEAHIPVVANFRIVLWDYDSGGPSS